MNRFAVTLALVALVGCSRSSNSVPSLGKSDDDAASTTRIESLLASQTSKRGGHAGFAKLPDRGELFAYPDGNRAKRDGAYTWHRAGVSEAHALRSINEGKLRVTTPSGEILDIQYDHHIEHESGDWTWVGHLPGDTAAQTILTFGAEAVFGSIGQVGKRSLRLTSRNGTAWLVETDSTKLASLASAGANPDKPDYLAIPKHLLGGQAATGSTRTQAAPTAAAAAAAAATIDVLVGYTGGIASRPGGASAAVTRINNLVAVTNEAYANSQISPRIRLVHTMQVNYLDASSNESALEQLTGYDVSEQRVTTPNAAFNALRAARGQYGADLVVLLRAFRDPEQDGCGIAWLIGGGKSASTIADQDYFGYSVVSDGTDRNEQDGLTYFCRDESFAHELGHNMGSAHDREAAEGGDNVLDDPDDYGAFAYSFGYKSTAANGNFYTVMAYGDQGQTDYRVFSNPRITFCGARACGTVNDDNARSLGQTMPLVATYRQSQGPEEPEEKAPARSIDVNANARADLFFFNHSTGQVFTWFMSGATRTATSTSAIPGGYSVVETGTFNADKRGDLLLRNSAGRLYMGISNGLTFGVQAVSHIPSSSYATIGTADVDGNGRSDILLRNPATGHLVVWYMNGATRTAYSAQAIGTGLTYVTSGDFNGDGRADLLLRNASRAIYIGFSTGTAFNVVATGLAHSSGYALRGVADVNGDGRSDILLHSSGLNRLVVWYMNGQVRTTFSSHAVPAGVTLVGKGDMDGNGRQDLVWVYPSGAIRVYFSNGTTFTSTLLAYSANVSVSRPMDIAL